MFVPSICSTGFSRLYLYCLRRGGTRMISLPASTGYLADVFLVNRILPSLPGIAVETQVLKSNFRGVTRNLFSKCMKQSIRAGQWFGWHRRVEVCSRHKWGLKVYRVKSCCSCCRWFEGCKACRKAADWFWCVGDEEGTSWPWALASQTCSSGWLQVRWSRGTRPSCVWVFWVISQTGNSELSEAGRAPLFPSFLYGAWALKKLVWYFGYTKNRGHLFFVVFSFMPCSCKTSLYACVFPIQFLCSL